MQNIYLLETTFFGYDTLFEAIFFAVTLLIAIFSFRIYKLSAQKQARLFGWSFLFFSLAYFIQSLINLFILDQMEDAIRSAIALPSVVLFNYIGLVIHMLFFSIALVLLLYMSLRIERSRVFWILLTVVILSLFMSTHSLSIFFVISAILLGFIMAFYIENYTNHKNIKTGTIALAFILLFVGHALFLFATQNVMYYVIANFVELVAYLLVLLNFYLVLKK